MIGNWRSGGIIPWQLSQLHLDESTEIEHPFVSLRMLVVPSPPIWKYINIIAKYIIIFSDTIIISLLRVTSKPTE